MIISQGISQITFRNSHFADADTAFMGAVNLRP